LTANVNDPRTECGSVGQRLFVAAAVGGEAGDLGECAGSVDASEGVQAVFGVSGDGQRAVCVLQWDVGQGVAGRRALSWDSPG
jgi:hypothetical protein